MRQLVIVLFLALLSACAPIATQGVTTLDFQPAAEDEAPIAAGTLLPTQRVPRNRLMSIAAAFEKAPNGSPILACYRKARVDNFWGPCSHITRKLSADRIIDTVGDTPLEAKVGIFPAKRLERYYYAIIVLDAGQRGDDLPVLEREAERLRGSPFGLGSQPGYYYCTSLQNDLERAAGRGDLVGRHPIFGLAMPADVLLQPRVKVLYVGVDPSKQ
ncbi:MAG TPA: hypothetical protein VNT60_03710 [Deinococcales bacterium]|nr:hypothetical protein [Deinococcales bacterium]